MNTLQTSFTDTTIVGDRVQTTIDLLNFSGVQAFKSTPANTEGAITTGVVIFIPAPTLHLFDGSKQNEAACMGFIRNLMFPFQELQRYVTEGDISGFAIVPEKDYVNEAWANQRTELIGKTLQSIAEGTIDPSR